MSFRPSVPKPTGRCAIGLTAVNIMGRLTMSIVVSIDADSHISGLTGGL